MPNIEIRKFYNDPICRICNRNVKGHSRTKCDNCNATVCQRHRPLFVHPWHCPFCPPPLNQFKPPQFNQVASVSDIFTKMACVEEEIDSGDKISAEEHASELFDLIFG